MDKKHPVVTPQCIFHAESKYVNDFLDSEKKIKVNRMWCVVCQQHPREDCYPHLRVVITDVWKANDDVTASCAVRSKLERPAVIERTVCKVAKAFTHSLRKVYLQQIVCLTGRSTWKHTGVLIWYNQAGMVMVKEKKETEKTIQEKRILLLAKLLEENMNPA